MSNNATKNSFYSTTNSSTSTLRPRNNRLISYEDELATTSVASALGSGASPRVISRDASPSTSGARAQSKGKTQTAQLRDSAPHRRNFSEAANAERRGSSGIWESWPSFQGIASSFLGADTAGSSGGNVKRSNSGNLRKSSSRMQQDKSYNVRQAQTEWGPKKQSESTPMSIDQHQMLLQTKKREALLSQSIATETIRDSLGRHKRKDSNASIRSPTDGADHDVLVYRHKVQPHDTMAGVLIKYSCQPEAFRKANRFWPNDNIQRKDWVVLPVDACAIRGRKTESPYVEGLLNKDGDEGGHQGVASKRVEDDGNIRSQNGAEPFPGLENDPPSSDSGFVHDSWVLMPSSDKPVEILRIAKKTLGYFPPTRRKSPSRSTITTPLSQSIDSTPKTSFDMLRHPPTHAAQQAQLNQQLQAAASLGSSPQRQSSIPRFMSPSSRNRSSSSISAPNGSSGNAFIAALSGPGGVGTLRGLRTEQARPGPAGDALNKKFAQYFPEQLPSDHPDYRANDRLRPPHTRTTSNSLRATPRASIDSMRSTRSNSSSVPAALAGWVGKVASSPMRKKNDLRLERSDLRLIGESDMAAGDLIELSDTPDEVSRQLHDAVGGPAVTGTSGAGGVSAASKADDDLLNERFPVRGRVRRAYEAD